MSWLDPLITKARNGDNVAARALLAYLTECLERGEAPPPALCGYFASAFKEVASGRSADDALNIGKYDNFKRHCEIAKKVWELTNRTDNRLPLRDSRRKDGAYGIVGREYSLSADRVQQIYREVKELIEDEYLERPTSFKAGRHFQADMAITFARLAEILKKQGRD